MSDCIFCKIIKKELPTEIVQENKDFIVIKDINPQAPIHFLLVPREHIPSMTELTKADRSLLGNILYETKILAAKYGLSERGYKVVVNCGQEGGQLVPHLHFHFLGGKKLGEFV